MECKLSPLEFRTISKKNGTKVVEYRQLVFSCALFNNEDPYVNVYTSSPATWSEWQIFPPTN